MLRVTVHLFWERSAAYLLLIYLFYLYKEIYRLHGNRICRAFSKYYYVVDPNNLYIHITL